MSRKLVLIVIFLIVVGLSYFAYRFLVSNFQQKSVNIVEVEKTAEVNQVRHLVENFGKRLQLVSLQSPDVSQEIQKEYSEFVSPALLKVWMNAPSKAPGRIVSSPWPDRIEITSLTKEEGEKYVINGYVVEITSVEVVNGGAAAKIPVHIVVQKEQGHWVITEYSEFGKAVTSKGGLTSFDVNKMSRELG